MLSESAGNGPRGSLREQRAGEWLPVNGLGRWERRIEQVEGIAFQPGGGSSSVLEDAEAAGQKYKMKEQCESGYRVWASRVIWLKGEIPT